MPGPRPDSTAVGQVDGSTAVISASLFGFLDEPLEDFEAHGMLDVLQVLVEGGLAFPDQNTVELHKSAREMPGAWLGSGRWRARPEEYVATLEKRGIYRLI